MVTDIITDAATIDLALDLAAEGVLVEVETVTELTDFDAALAEMDRIIG